MELINELNKVAGYKINTQESVIFLYNNKLSEREIKKIISFNCIKQNKTPRNKSNQRAERLVFYDYMTGL